MVASNILKRQETQFEHESRLFDEKEALVNAEVFAAAQANQAAERARLARLRGGVAGANESGGNVAGPSGTEENVAGVADPSPAEFLKAWKKIGSARENKEWNEMDREVRSNISRSHSSF
jgi:hypothetical protein